MAHIAKYKAPSVGHMLAHYRRDRSGLERDNIVDFYLFWDWCDEHNDEWSRLLDDSCCYAIGHYMRSFRAAQVVTQEDRDALRAKRVDDGCHTDCQTGAIQS